MGMLINRHRDRHEADSKPAKGDGKAKTAKKADPKPAKGDGTAKSSKSDN